jgi:DedD protein
MADTRTELLRAAEPPDTEIILGTGKLLGIFFGLVGLCAIFFSMGYMLGRGSSSAGKTEIVGNASSGARTNGKPSAADKTTTAGPTQPCAAGSPDCGAPASSQSANTTAPTADTTSASAVAPASTGSSSSSSGDRPALGGIYMVQVAAVSKREDADILVSALQKKQYPVFVASVPGDALFHVQVGPFTDSKDAETMRSRLSADGYNAIVKK